MRRILITTHTRLELDGEWRGFGFQRGKLWTPERHELAPHDLTWLGLQAGIVREFQRMMHSRKAGYQDGIDSTVTSIAEAIARRSR